jgi:thiamine biosynthesis lipoprotein ApbE
VIGPDGAIADALATALMVDGIEGARWFAHLPQWSGAVVVDDTLTWWGPAFRTPTNYAAA